MQTDSKLGMTTLNEARFDEHVATLTSSQKAFPNLVKDWVQRPRNMVVLVSGGPGTGKTFTVTKTLEWVQVVQLRMAYAARIAQRIGGRTIHSALRLDWKEGSLLRRLEKELENETDQTKCIEKSSVLMAEFSCTEKPSIVVVDEIAMVPDWLLFWMIKYFFRRKTHPVLFVGMGDLHQLRPVKSNNNLFSLTSLGDSFETHRIVFVESKRFSPEYEPVIQKLCEFVDRNDPEGMFEFIASTFNVVEAIDGIILKRCSRAFSFRNDTVIQYNKFYIRHMCKGARVRIYHWDIKSNSPILEKYTDLKAGCLMYVTENGCSEATNGTLLFFDKYLSERDVLVCKYPKTGDVVLVRRNRNGIFPVEVGFAATVHKVQGETLDDKAIAINFDGLKDVNWAYTACSRTREMGQILAICI